MASPNWKGAGGLEHAAQAEFERILDTFGGLEHAAQAEFKRIFDTCGGLEHAAQAELKRILDTFGGLEYAAQAELKRILDTFGTLEYVLLSEVDEAIAKYEADRVLTLRIVAPLKEKRDSNGILIKNSMLITVAQTKAHSLGKNAFSAVTSPYTIRLFVHWALQTPGATFETWNVSSTCYHGEIQPAESRGITYFAHIPAGWELLGYGSTDPKTGRRMALSVRQVIPGLIVPGAE